MLHQVSRPKGWQGFLFFVAMATIVLLPGCKGPPPENLFAEDPVLREETAIEILKDSEGDLEIEDKDLPAFLNALKDESKNVRMATLKVLRAAREESTIPEILELFKDEEIEVRELAIEVAASFGDLSSEAANKVLWRTLDEDEDLSEDERQRLQECAVITLTKTGAFEAFLDKIKSFQRVTIMGEGTDLQLSNDIANWVRIGANYYQIAGDKEGLKTIASYYLGIGDYKEAESFYAKAGSETEGYQSIADAAFEKMDYGVAAHYYEKAGDQQKAAESLERMVKVGQWEGHGIKFTVSSSGRKITYLEVTIPFRGGKQTSYIRTPIEIENRSFSCRQSAGMSDVRVKGNFTSAETAAGSASFYASVGGYGGTFIEGSLDWTANFKK